MTRSTYGSIIRQIGRLMTSIMQSAMKAEMFFAALTRNGCECTFLKPVGTIYKIKGSDSNPINRSERL